MSRFRIVSLIVLLVIASAHAQHAANSAGDTLEGYWQDTARRVLYSRSAPTSYVYGAWTAIDQGQTYPAAKYVQRKGSSWEVVDLNFDDANYAVTTIAGTAQTIDFVRTVKWSGCAMHHQCGLQGNDMVCALENICPQEGQSVVDWRGEERYARRTACERRGGAELQGIPVSCR